MLVAIDYSLNSPAMTVFKNGEYHFFNFYQDSKLREPSDFKKDNIDYAEFLHINNFHVIPFNRKALTVKEYSEKEIAKLEDALNLQSIIAAQVTKLGTPLFTAFEGYSYGSKGNSALDLAAGVALLRSRMYMITDKNIKIYSPSTIKKLAGKGNANKMYMVEAFLDNKLDDQFLANNSFWKWSQYKYNRDLYFKDKDTIRKPFDDIIDSYWIMQKLISEIKSQEPETKSLIK